MTVTSVRRVARPSQRVEPGRTDRLDRTWVDRALCRDNPRFEDGPFGTKPDGGQLARILAHRCRAHCPVIAECTAELIAQRPVRPVRAIRAGVWFPSQGSPVVPVNEGCRASCDGLPAVHRTEGASK